MYSAGKMEELKSYARNTTRLMTIFAAPVLLVIWFFPSFIMSFFGKGFSEGIWLLRVLALGQFINVITGSVGYLLVMSGHEKDMRNITIINGVLALILALILNPFFGVIGSAISTSIALASSNLMAVGLVKKRLGFNTLSILGFK
jgi:O-antigen/teichoic acid export membrane protein